MHHDEGVAAENRRSVSVPALAVRVRGRAGLVATLLFGMFWSQPRQMRVSTPFAAVFRWTQVDSSSACKSQSLQANEAQVRNSQR